MPAIGNSLIEALWEGAYRNNWRPVMEWLANHASHYTAASLLFPHTVYYFFDLLPVANGGCAEVDEGMAMHVFYRTSNCQLTTNFVCFVSPFDFEPWARPVHLPQVNCFSYILVPGYVRRKLNTNGPTDDHGAPAFLWAYVRVYVIRLIQDWNGSNGPTKGKDNRSSLPIATI